MLFAWSPKALWLAFIPVLRTVSCLPISESACLYSLSPLIPTLVWIPSFSGMSSPPVFLVLYGCGSLLSLTRRGGCAAGALRPPAGAGPVSFGRTRCLCLYST